MASASDRTDPEVLGAGVLEGRRADLARAITLVESTNPQHRVAAQELLLAMTPHAGHSFRVGITGVPGVGKSTTIETLGMYLISQGHRVAVLAVDPSSTRTGGSILGDKTRMGRLAAHPDAYIRPSPTAGTLGGVAKATRETIVLVEAAGYEIVLSVHDELITEAPDTDDFGSDQLVDLMSVVPPWAEGLPLAAAGFEAYRYRKG